MRRFHLLQATVLSTALMSILCSPSALAADCIKTGTVLKATNSVAVRSTPPTEKFLFVVGSPGPQIATLAAGTTVTIIDTEIISAPLRKDIWIMGVTTGGVSGWIYCGSPDKAANFRLAR